MIARRRSLGLGLVAVLLITAAPARSQTLIADISDHLVAITTGFAGARVLLFGAIDGPGDVVVMIRGPEKELVVRRKSRVAGIWINTSSMTFDQVPGFYAIAATAPLEEIASQTLLTRLEFGLENLRLPLPPAKASPSVADEWRDAVVRNYQRAGLYSREVGRVSLVGDRLFRTTLTLPANVPTGLYQVQVFLLQDGRVVSAQTTPLAISKIGLEAEIYDFAYERSALYGAIAILLALLAGWLAHMAFRRK